MLIFAMSAIIFSSCSSNPTLSNNGSGALINRLPIAVSNQLSSDNQDSSILHPISCNFQRWTIVAHGTFNRHVSEGYIRYGDVVELYAYTSLMRSESIRGNQVINLIQEHTFFFGKGDSWQVEGSVDKQIGVPVQCIVAIQSTHAFMPAGSAGS